MLPSFIPSLIFGSALMLLVTACKTVNPPVSAPKAVKVESKDTPHGFIGYMYKKYNPYPIQDDPETPDDCTSIYMPADSRVPYQGVAVFFHGFSACPQQFYEMAQILSKRGFTVLALLGPGEGMAPAPLAENDARRVSGMDYKDYYARFLPKVQNENWRRYAEFVADVNRFVETQAGEKIVAGLSGGGALATYAYIEKPGLYSRALLISPYYGMPGAYLGRKSQTSGQWQGIKRLAGDAVYQIHNATIQNASELLSLAATNEVSWGEDCYRLTRGFDGNTGRRGTCDFRYENLAALNSFGAFVLSELKGNSALNSLPQVQYVAVEWDSGTDTHEIRRAIAYQRARFGSRSVSACFYPNNIPHSIFARKDIGKYDETPWVNSFLYESSAFLANGKEMKESEEISEETVYDGVQDKDTKDRQKRCSLYNVGYDEILQQK